MMQQNSSCSEVFDLFLEYCLINSLETFKISTIYLNTYRLIFSPWNNA